MVKARRINPSSLYSGAPYDYATVAPSGSTVFTAGACPIGPDGQVVARGDLEGQTRQAFDNLVVVLKEAGSSLEQVLKTTVYVVTSDPADLLRVWGDVEEGFGPNRPSSTLLGVNVLGYPDQRVEIEAIALA